MDSMCSWLIQCDTNDVLTDERTAELLFLGDVALAGRVGDALRQRGRSFLFEKLPSRFFNADVVCFNLECCLSKRGRVWEPKPVPLRGQPEFLGAFPRTNGRYVANVANNHFLDYGEDAALDTLQALSSYGMETVGTTGPSGTERCVFLETRAGRVALAGFSPSGHPLPHSTRVNVATERVCDMVSQVQAMRTQSDVVIVSVHQGVEHTPYVDRRARKLTHRLVDAGASCVICHHPHVIRGIETYKGVPIFHSLGNFVIDSDFERRPWERNSLVLRLALQTGRLRTIAIEACVITDHLQPRLATREEQEQIRRVTASLSSMLESKLGSGIGYLRCGLIKAQDTLSSICVMIRQKGVVVAVRYYLQRLAAKAKCRMSRCD